MNSGVQKSGNSCRHPLLMEECGIHTLVASSVETHLKPLPRLQAQNPQAKELPEPPLAMAPGSPTPRCFLGHPTPSLMQEVENESVLL